MTTDDPTDVLVVTIDDDGSLYEAGRDAIDRLSRDEPVPEPPTVTFASADQLATVFNERTYRLLRVIRTEAPTSIRETARLVDRDVKNVHEELTTLEALGVIRFEADGRAKRPVFPYDDLVIRPVADPDDPTTAVPGN